MSIITNIYWVLALCQALCSRCIILVNLHVPERRHKAYCIIIFICSWGIFGSQWGYGTKVESLNSGVVRTVCFQSLLLIGLRVLLGRVEGVLTSTETVLKAELALAFGLLGTRAGTVLTQRMKKGSLRPGDGEYLNSASGRWWISQSSTQAGYCGTSHPACHFLSGSLPCWRALLKLLLLW